MWLIPMIWLENAQINKTIKTFPNVKVSTIVLSEKIRSSIRLNLIKSIYNRFRKKEMIRK